MEPGESQADPSYVETTSVFDREWYEHQLPRTFKRELAARRHYAGHANRLRSPHPLFEPLWLYPRGSWQRTTSDPLTFALGKETDPGRSPHPLVDLARLPGRFEEWVAGLTDDTVLPALPGLAEVRYADLRAHLLGERVQVTPEPDPERITVVVPVHHELRGAVELLRKIRIQHPELELELLLCASGGDALHRIAHAVTFALDGARTVEVEKDAGWAATAMAGVQAATGGVVVLARPEVRCPDWPWLAELAEAVPGGGLAVPLQLKDDHTVAAAGASYPGAAPEPLLAGLTIGDAERLIDVPGPWPGVVAATTATLREAGLRGAAGDGWVEVDLGRRLSRTVLTCAAQVLTSREPSSDPTPLVQLWREPPPGTREAWATAGLAAGGTRLPDSPLRWAIDIAAPGGPLGRHWGDHHFAESLAAALERQGQLATIDTRHSRGRESRALEDVVLVIRGLDQVERGAERSHLVWVISHPELVAPDELQQADAAFAASATWAARRSDEWGVKIIPLLQCTDTTRFHLHDDAGEGPQVLFVGNARKDSRRPVVDLAVEHAEGLVIYGKAWTGEAADHVAAESVPNTELSALYASAGLVLNDHWADMREEGFVSNRLFDAAASGARVLSDRVDGLDELFGGVVRTFADAEEFRSLVAEPWDQHFPDDAERRRIAARVAAEHSFDARAGELIATVLRHPPFTTSSGGSIRGS